MKVSDSVGGFAGDKDAAASIRETYLLPNLRTGKEVHLDFESVALATQSFIHALLAQAIREDSAYLELIAFEHCNSSVQSIIEIVVEYAQDELA